MKINRSYAAAVAAMVVLALGVGWATAEQAGAASDKIVGNADGAAFVYTQSGGYCEEGAANIVYGELRGSRMHEATIVAEATKLGVYIPAAGGSDWYGLPKLLSHYGIKSTEGTHTLKTVEADLAAGDRVIAAVNGETLWAAAGYSFLNTDFTSPDHAVVLDEVDETTGRVLVSDTGAGASYVVTTAAWNKAVALGGYSYDIIPVQK